jgi:hypothetical protein
VSETNARINRREDFLIAMAIQILHP